MSGETTTTVVGNLTDDPELHQTPAGAVASFTVASTARFLNRDTGEWRDGEPLFLRCTVWQTPAEHAAASLYRGARVIVTGRLRQRSFESAGGEKRTAIELTADEVGVSLRFAPIRTSPPLRATPSEVTSTPA